MKCFFLFLLLFSSLYSKERLVVLEFSKSSGVPNQIIVSSYSYFISELARAEKYDIIEKSEMKTVIEELELQQTGCMDTYCEIQIGEMLSADKIVSGTILKKGKKYIISINVRNVNDKSLAFAETVNLEDVNKLEKYMSFFAQKIISPDSTHDLSPEEITKKEIKPPEPPPKPPEPKPIVETPKLTPEEERKIAETNKKLDKNWEDLRSASWRSLLLPGWGHSYLGLSSDKGYYLINGVTAISAYLWHIFKEQPDNIHLKEKVIEDRVKYVGINNAFNPDANNPLFLYFVYNSGQVELRNQRRIDQGSLIAAISIFYTTMFLAMGDIKNVKETRDKAALISFRWKSDFLATTPTREHKSSYLEISYEWRF